MADVIPFKLPQRDKLIVAEIRLVAIAALVLVVGAAWYDYVTQRRELTTIEASSNAVQIESRRIALSRIFADAAMLSSTEPQEALDHLNPILARLQGWTQSDDGDPYAALASQMRVELEAARNEVGRLMLEGKQDKASDVVRHLALKATEAADVIK